MNDFSTNELSIQPASSIAELFKSTRQQQGYSLDHIAGHLRVSKSYIEAIETNDVDHFPARVYILGFVKSYALFLNLNSDECCKRFKSEVLGEQAAEPNLNFPTLLTIDSSPSSKILKTSLGLLAIALASGIFIWQSRMPITDNTLLKKDPDIDLMSDSSETQKPISMATNNERINYTSQSLPENNQKLSESSESSESSDLSQTTDPSSSTISETSLPQQQDQSINFKFTQECWIKVQDSTQQVLIEKIFQPGESYSLPMRDGYRLYTGNAGGLLIMWPGKPVISLGKKGQVIANLSLDSETLSAYLDQQ